jgi:hypothetical protein
VLKETRWTTPLSLRQDRHLCDSERQRPG